ncbi:MAG: hypothetical protein DHS20C18_30680 [Saprospiraceae bacterium]|nr:MAG: hypothetical protein DHS20C18_30680 [Saprospiraceae bacterium]
MPYTHTLHQDNFLTREVIPFPRADEFFNLLQDRMHMVVEGFILEEKFTLFVNTIPRDEARSLTRYENVPLIYAGIPRQRELLEGPKRQWKPTLNDFWNFLDVSHLSSSTAVVSSQLYRAFKMGSYNLKDIPKVGMGRLEDYFEAILYPESSVKQATPRQEAEYHILKSYFNVMEDNYLSLPLIQFGEFDGIVHLVYKAQDSRNLTMRSIGNIIRSVSVVYESLILEWDLVGRNMEKSEAVQLPLSPVFYEQINRNPILKELKYDEYYKKHLPFFKSRIRLNDRVIHSKVYSPYLKAAIISIMIDSYAHNISAHSLVALNWWFKRRAENIRQESENHFQEVEEVKELIDEFVPEGFDQDRILELIQPWMEGQFVKDHEEEYDVVRYPGSLDREIQPLIKFLMQKGAFWSGIARDNHFGGEARSLFHILWEDFINNPLYLGTIAKSEDIHKISIHITHYAAETVEEKNNSSCRKPKRALKEGVFVEIDIKNRRPRAQWDEQNIPYLQTDDGKRLSFAEHKELDGMSDFVKPGVDYSEMKEVLRSCLVFFPGEVVGRHAFFTMLENEIRNVKHYKGSDLLEIQQNGLKLNLSIQETNVTNKEKDLRELYKVGVWIGTPTDLQIQGNVPLVKRKYNALIGDIMDEETFAPRLGGSFQDKICAGMLFNNKFDQVQNGDENPAREQGQDTSRDKTYYPWIIPATSPAEAPHDDVEVFKNQKESSYEFNVMYNHQRGFFKKYFFIWKAANTKLVGDIEDVEFVWENLARFKFVSLSPDDTEKRMALWRKVRANGVIRIVDQEDQHAGETPESDQVLLEAYKSWLKEWISESSYSIKFLVDGLPVGQFVFRKDGEDVFRYYNTAELPVREQEFEGKDTLNVAHGGFSLDPEVLRYRTHGIYKTYFMRDIQGNGPVSSQTSARLIELFEVLTTRICIFDNRIRHRIRNHDREAIFKSALKLSIFGEQAPRLNDERNWEGEWETQKADLIGDCHFLILHLSYIEKILLTKYSDHQDYSEENIGLFIAKEIIPAITRNGRLRKNFILVITSGRGRTKWWSKMNENRKYQPFTHFTIFRPVESLISGIEDALGRKDDIELKYNMVKVLFGS